MKLKGKAIKLGNDINTDLIISGRYKFSITDMKELAKYIFEDLDPGFVKKVRPNESIIVAGENFGMGSSREQAPLVIKEAGILAVVAKSFARIFYRNAFNIGLNLIEADTDKIDENDNIEIDLDRAIINNETRGEKIKILPIPKVLQTLLADGGLVNHFKKNNGLRL
ncbi:MAG: 3-isopropylmalate dehydratase [Candidatus Omnitrophica bacterium CG11_big_fil_rev_8_21_14_0_20_42_13]|uniref:3-isopropylmalate dehydratase small subunit n=1 Tax=Candidatus Ghiorseimicrobium undicola TaxID=1974746 RepID=A0A2H0LVC8_9BACT|nr:MAG: 3-isopropylmalate dehydratase [Candidatus Omnitrophica bacterium CG11_big_fil_rev_8_21_14_0_20_42_13]